MFWFLAAGKDADLAKGAGQGSDGKGKLRLYHIASFISFAFSDCNKLLLAMFWNKRVCDLEIGEPWGLMIIWGSSRVEWFGMLVVRGKNVGQKLRQEIKKHMKWRRDSLLNRFS